MDSEGNSVQKFFSFNVFFLIFNIFVINLFVSLFFCVGLNVLVMAFFGQVVDQYFWYNEFGVLLGVGNSYLVVVEGDFLKLQVQVQCGSCFLVLVFVVFEVEIIDVFFEVVGNVQVGESLFFQANNVGYVNYNWDFGDGNMVVGQSVQYIYFIFGAFEVFLEVVSQLGCSLVMVQSLDVEVEEQLLLFFNMKDVFCVGSIVGLVIVMVQGGMFLYNFMWGNGQDGVIFMGLEVGMYIVIVIDVMGFVIEGIIEVDNLEVDILQFVIIVNGGVVVCKNEFVFFVVIVFGYLDVIISWYESLFQFVFVVQGGVFVSLGYVMNVVLYMEVVVEGCFFDMLQYVVEVQVL